MPHCYPPAYKAHSCTCCPLPCPLQVGVGFHVYRHPAAAFEQRQLIATVPHRRPLAPAWVHDFPATQVWLADLVVMVNACYVSWWRR